MKTKRIRMQYLPGCIIYKVTETRGWFGGYGSVADREELAALGIDPSAARELSRKRVEDGFFTDTYEVIYEAPLSGDVWETVDAISVGGVPNPNIEWITDTITMENVGTFNEQNNSFVYTEEGILTGVENPIRFKVKDDCINDAHIGFHITVTASSGVNVSKE